MKFRLSIAGAALAAAVFTLAPAARAQTTILRMHGTFNAEYTSSRGMEIFKAEAERLSGGSIEIELHPGITGAVGTREVLDDIRSQDVFGIWIGAAHFSRLVPEIGALSLPYVFDNYAQVGRALKGPAGAAIEAKMAAKGVMSLGWFMYGAQNMANTKRPLRTLDDFKDLKIRVLPDETRLATFRALGANPVALDFKDLFLVLPQHDIDGMENSYSIIRDYKFYEHLTYLSDTSHNLDLIPFVANRKMFMSLQPRQQKAIREAAAIAVARQWKMVDTEEAEALATLKEKGMQFDPLPSGTRAALRQATAVVIENARKRFGKEIIDSVLAATGRPAPAQAATAGVIGSQAGQGRVSTKRN
jgi:tripartite ATP-independent transporter DctP family solute receptor